MSHYNKFIAALVAALAVAGSVAADGDVIVADWLAIAAAFIGALAVRQVANTPFEPSDDA